MMPEHTLFWTAALVSCAAAQCSRSFLVDATAKYVAAQTQGNPAILTAIAAANLNYTESDKTVDIAAGVLAQPMKIDHNRSIHDTTVCATFTELIVTDPAKPYVIGTRMVFTDSKASLIETIATKPGDWAFNATGYLHWCVLIIPVLHTPIPNRAELRLLSGNVPLIKASVGVQELPRKLGHHPLLRTRHARRDSSRRGRLLRPLRQRQRRRPLRHAVRTSGRGSVHRQPDYGNQHVRSGPAVDHHGDQPPARR
jgi:hypothetical protein